MVGKRRRWRLGGLGNLGDLGDLGGDLGDLYLYRRGDLCLGDLGDLGDLMSSYSYQIYILKLMAALRSFADELARFSTLVYAGADYPA
jgi:hypothetical protein